MTADERLRSYEKPKGQRRPRRHLRPVRPVVVQRSGHPDRRRRLALPDGVVDLQRTGALIYLALALVMLFAGLYRYFGIRKYQKAGIGDDYMSAARAETFYLIGGTIQGFFLGLFCFVSLLWSRDLYAEIASVAVALGSTVTIVGRNYGSKAMVSILTLTVVSPITLALMLRGDVGYFVLGLYTVLFMGIILRMATHVRTVLFTAIIEEKKSTRLAQRFDRALNTMTHGLIMLDSDGRVVVANAEAGQAFATSTSDRLIGRSLKALVMRAVAGGLLSAKDGHYLEAQLTRALREGRGRKVLMRLGDARHVEFSVSEGAGGLGVITFEDVSQRIEAEDKIRSMARYDNLTGLANRAYFHELVGEMMASGDHARTCALVVFDLDDFKSVNDTLGHPIGDGLIYAVAEKLQGFASDALKVSRFGGDEFMIYVDRIEGEAELSVILDELFASLQGEVDVAGHSLRIQASAGAVLSRVKDGDVDTMIVKADLALYKAKELGKNGWRLFEAAMDAAFRNRQLLKADLRSAIEARDCASSTSRSWRSTACASSAARRCAAGTIPSSARSRPRCSSRSPRKWASSPRSATSCCRRRRRECVRWPEQTSVSVNLSAKDFRNRDVVDKVRNALAQSGLAAASPRDRGDRDRAARRQVLRARADPGAEGARRAHRARRFRHRLFQPQLSAQAAARQDQDRPQLPDRRHPEPALAGAAHRHRQPVAAARPERHGGRRRDLRAAEAPGAEGEAGPGARVPVRLGAFGVRHRDHVVDGMAVRGRAEIGGETRDSALNSAALPQSSLTLNPMMAAAKLAKTHALLRLTKRKRIPAKFYFSLAIHSLRFVYQFAAGACFMLDRVHSISRVSLRDEKEVEVSSFTRSVLNVLDHVEYRYCDGGEDLEAIYRLRYDCISRRGCSRRMRREWSRIVTTSCRTPTDTAYSTMVAW